MAKEEWMCDKDGCVKVATNIEKLRRRGRLTRDQFCGKHTPRDRASDFKPLPPRTRE